MARYRYEHLRAFLIIHGCYSEGDAFEIGVAWYNRDGMPFTLPSPIDGWVDADVIDLILVDRWVGAGMPSIRRYSDTDEA